MPRLFYALWPTPAVRAALADAAAAFDLRDSRAVPPDNLHLTLAFLGAVDDGRCAALRRAPGLPVPCFTLCFDRGGWWRASRVAWTAPLAWPAALDDLAAGLVRSAGAVGLECDPRPFQPHVTLARGVARAPRIHGAIAVTWPVTDYALVASVGAPEGARYEVLERWPLGGAGAVRGGPAP